MGPKNRAQAPQPPPGRAFSASGGPDPVSAPERAISERRPFEGEQVLAHFAAFRKELAVQPLVVRLQATLDVVGDLVLYGRLDRVPEDLRQRLCCARDDLRTCVMDEEGREC